MKKGFLKCVITMLIPALIFICNFCNAQTTTAVEDFKPAVTNQPGKQFPQVNSERRVRASIAAPQSNKVQLDIGGKNMT